MLAALRAATGEPAPRAPAPGLAGSTTSSTQARGAGLRVDARRRAATSAPLPAGVDLAAYRIVQEALTNVLRHAGAATRDRRVDRLRRPTRWSCRSTTTAAAPGPTAAATAAANGLPGMRERAARARRHARGRAAARAAGSGCARGCRCAADGRLDDPRPARRRPGARARRLPRAARRAARHRGRRRGGRRREAVRARRASTCRTSCSWTSACRAWTVSRRRAGSPPTRRSPTCASSSSPRSSSTSTCSRRCASARAASSSRTPSRPS